MISLYEPDTCYLRLVLAVHGACPTGDCALLSPGAFQTVGPTAEIDAFSFDDAGRPLTDLLVNGQVPYDRSLYDPDVPAVLQSWLEAPLEECGP